MLMNVQPIPTVSERVNEVRALAARIVNREILPNENLLWARHVGARLTRDDIDQARELRGHCCVDVDRDAGDRAAGPWPCHRRTTWRDGSYLPNAKGPLS